MLQHLLKSSGHHAPQGCQPLPLFSLGLTSVLWHQEQRLAHRMGRTGSNRVPEHTQASVLLEGPQME